MSKDSAVVFVVLFICGFIIGIGIEIGKALFYNFSVNLPSDIESPNLLRLECREGQIQLLEEKENGERKWLMTGLQCEAEK